MSALTILYFYPRSPCGERPVTARIIDPTFGFLSTLSLRRATSAPVACGPDADISIHALLAESDATTANKALQKIISIHALLAESDGRQQEQDRVFGISIHALLAESDPTMQRALGVFSISIHALLAESDLSFIIYSITDNCISIHALLAESDTVFSIFQVVIIISIHALLAESDKLLPLSFNVTIYFYPRSPCGERQHSGA